MVLCNGLAILRWVAHVPARCWAKRAAILKSKTTTGTATTAAASHRGPGPSLDFSLRGEEMLAWLCDLGTASTVRGRVWLVDFMHGSSRLLQFNAVRCTRLRQLGDQMF